MRQILASVALLAVCVASEHSGPVKLIIDTDIGGGGCNDGGGVIRGGFQNGGGVIQRTVGRCSGAFLTTSARAPSGARDAIAAALDTSV